MNLDEEKLKKLQEQEKGNPNRLKIVRVMTFFKNNMGVFALNPPESEAEKLVQKLKEIIND